MAKATATDSMLRVTHQVDRVNLYDFGYEKSGSVKGDPDIYASFLDRIMNGDLVEENYEGFTEEEKKDRIKQIKQLEKQQKELEAGNEVINEEIKDKEKQVEKYHKELLQISEKKYKDKEKLKAETFSPVKFSINLVLLITVSVYLFFFYVSATYKALYVDLEGIEESIAQGTGTGSIMPAPYELSEAIQYNFLLFLVPFVFYAFGWAFHILLELKTKVKYVLLSFLIAVTFTVDFLLAMIIHTNIDTAKYAMGLPTTLWSQSASFYIILFLGFLVYIIWSILLDSLLREWDKKQVTTNLKKIIAHLKGDISNLERKKADVSTIKTQITNFREDIATVMYGNLKKYIDQFSSGWISYLSPANMKDAKDSCLLVKKQFEDKNDIRNGIVKVVSKR